MKPLQLEAKQVDVRYPADPKAFVFADQKTLRFQVRRVLRGSFDIRGRFESVGGYENECTISGTLVFAEDGVDEAFPRRFELVLTREDADAFVSTIAALSDYLTRNAKTIFVPTEYAATVHDNITVTVVQETPARTYDRWEITIGRRKAVLTDTGGNLMAQIREVLSSCARWQPEKMPRYGALES